MQSIQEENTREIPFVGFVSFFVNETLDPILEPRGAFLSGPVVLDQAL